jgi:hypothetical protein
MDVSIWIVKVLESFQNWDIETVIKLLGNAKISVKGDIEAVIAREVSKVIENESDKSAFIEFASNYAKYMLLKQEHLHVLKAFAALNQAVKGYCRFYQSSVLSGSWSVRLIDSLCRKLKDIATPAEEEYKKVKEETKDVTEPPLKLAKMSLENAFNKSQIIKEPFPDSRKLAAFYVVIHIWEMYFIEGKYRMCQRFVSWVEKMQDGFELLPNHTKISYFYYEGILNLFSYHYLKAHKSLTYWVEHWDESGGFKSRVTRYLVPINILFGEFPEDELLKTHNLKEYKGIAEACETGDLILFENSMAKYEEIFLKTGVYLVIEKLKNLVHRNFLKKYTSAEDTHIIKLEPLWEAYNKVMEESKKSEESKGSESYQLSITGLECILAGLIYKGFIKGYISHEKAIMVLAKNDPFPDLKTVVEKNWVNI